MSHPPKSDRVTLPQSLYLRMAECYFGNGPRHNEDRPEDTSEYESPPPVSSPPLPTEGTLLDGQHTHFNRVPRGRPGGFAARKAAALARPPEQTGGGGDTLPATPAPSAV